MYIYTCVFLYVYTYVCAYIHTQRELERDFVINFSRKEEQIHFSPLYNRCRSYIALFEIYANKILQRVKSDRGCTVQ